MMVLITYDVSTQDPDGRKRLRKIAKACLNYGQRVQHSVFECDIDPAQWVTLKALLLREMDLEQDSLRFYQLGAQWRKRVEHFGIKPAIDYQDILII